MRSPACPNLPVSLPRCRVSVHPSRGLLTYLTSDHDSKVVQLFAQLLLCLPRALQEMLDSEECATDIHIICL